MSAVNVCKRGKYYQYVFEAGKICGKRKRITKCGFKTKKEAQEAGTKALNDYLNTGLTFKENFISYADYLDYWIENYCKPNLKYNTIRTYETIIEKYIKPYLGIYRLNSLTSVKLNAFIVEICNKYTFSRAYFRTILKVLKGTFREACTYGFIRYNPALVIRLPKIEQKLEKVKHVYSQEEIDMILARFKGNDTFTCAFLTSCYTGMRTGEVFALTWEDIDFENNKIYVRHSIYDKKKDDKGKWYIGSTKTETGQREVYINSILMNALLNYKKKQEYLKSIYGKQYVRYHIEDVRNEHGKVIEHRIVKNDYDTKYNKNIELVFTNKNGNFAGTDTTRYPYKIIHKELGIKKCRFYDLRGSYATKILNNGVGIRDVADILGHKNIETTENYYISSSETSRTNANKLLENLIQSETINSITDYNIETVNISKKNNCYFIKK